MMSRCASGAKKWWSCLALLGVLVCTAAYAQDAEDPESAAQREMQVDALFTEESQVLAQAPVQAAGDAENLWIAAPTRLQGKDGVWLLHRHVDDEPGVIRTATKLAGKLGDPGLAAGGGSAFVLLEDKSIWQVRAAQTPVTPNRTRWQYQRIPRLAVPEQITSYQIGCAQDQLWLLGHGVFENPVERQAGDGPYGSMTEQEYWMIVLGVDAYPQPPEASDSSNDSQASTSVQNETSQETSQEDDQPPQPQAGLKLLQLEGSQWRAAPLPKPLATATDVTHHHLRPHEEQDDDQVQTMAKFFLIVSDPPEAAGRATIQILLTQNATLDAPADAAAQRDIWTLWTWRGFGPAEQSAELRWWRVQRDWPTGDAWSTGPLSIDAAVSVDGQIVLGEQVSPSTWQTWLTRQVRMGVDQFPVYELAKADVDVSQPSREFGAMTPFGNGAAVLTLEPPAVEQQDDDREKPVAYGTLVRLDGQTEPMQPLVIREQPLPEVSWQHFLEIGALALATVLLVTFWPRELKRGMVTLPAGLKPATFPKRVGAGLIDLVPAVIVVSVMLPMSPMGAGLAWPGVTEPQDAEQLLAPLLVIVLFVLYTSISEWLMKTTPGKRILGLKVTTLDGGKPGAFALGVRNGLRVLDLVIPVLLLLPVLWPRRQRLGDLVAQTMVVEATHDDDTDEKKEAT